MSRRALAASGLAAALAACTVGPDYRAPQTTAPDAFADAASVATSDAPVAAWWTTFGDPVLDALVDRAVRSNPGLQEAQARVREARALRGVVAADLSPTVDASGRASRSRTSENVAGLPTHTTNLFQAGFDAAWEIDLFGGVRRSVEAADAEVAASVEDRRDVLVSLLAEVARNYVELRGSQRQAAIAASNVAAQRQTLELTRTRLTAGLATELDVARAEATTHTTAAAIPSLESEARRAIHALGVLLGQAPDALSAELTPASPLVVPPPQVPAGLPSDLLRRRPDVRRAERRLAAATARIGAAQAGLFPKFSLTAALGLSSDGLGNLLDARSRTASLAGGVRWPLLDFGRVRENVAVQAAREEQAFAAYRTVVLSSLREVEDALVALSKERERRASLEAAVAASLRASELASQLWTAGRSDFLSVLQAERDVFAAQDALVLSDRRAASDLVALYKSLGGGWEIEAQTSDSAPSGEPGRRVVTLTAPEPPPAER